MQDEMRRVPREELVRRLDNFRKKMTETAADWQMAVINHKVNMYYMSGTMQDGVLVITPEDAVLWVRRDFERAKNESNFSDIRPMKSFRDLAEFYQIIPKAVYLETKTATLDWINLLKKYMPFEAIQSVNPVMDKLRLIKSDYEIACMKQAGEIHRIALEENAQKLIRSGISEAELAVEIYSSLLKMGSHGIARFNLAMGEDLVGIASFGKSGLIRTAFDGPGGTGGTCIAVQSIGSAFRKLTQNCLVYLDIPSGIDGYHTDKSVVYYFGDLEKDPRGSEILNAHNYCVYLEKHIAGLLTPGAILEDIYASVMKRFDMQYADGFMNGGKFLGHSIGLTMDEAPAIARGFKTELKAGMTFAIEPKIAIDGVGVVGTENTYYITRDGAVSLTGQPLPLIQIL